MLLLVGCTGPVLNPSILPPTAAFTRTSPPISTKATAPTQELTALPTARLSSDYSLVISPVEDASVEHYGLLELDLQTNLQATNPYDPNEIDLRVRFTAPSKKESETEAFWYQGYDLQTRKPSGNPGWKVRFTPDEAGDWKAIAYARKPGSLSASISFCVSTSNRPGFIRIHPTNPRYLAYDNGDFFFPIGLNMGWWGGCCDPIDQYGRWFDLFTENGGNTIRV
jgi:hypothetical protein